MITILLILLILMLVGAFPSWPYSRGWGYYPSGGIGLIVLIVVVLLLVGAGYVLLTSERRRNRRLTRPVRRVAAAGARDQGKAGVVTMVGGEP